MPTPNALFFLFRCPKTVKTSITAFRSAKFRQIRAALVETDGPTQVLNFVMFPHPRRVKQAETTTLSLSFSLFFISVVRSIFYILYAGIFV